MPAIYIGGSLFFIIILFAGRFAQSYSHAKQSISELGIPGTAYGWLVRWVGFFPLGLSFMVFACQSGSMFTNSTPSILLIIIGVAILLAGIFPTDPDNQRGSASGKIHAGAVISLLLLLSIAPFIFSISSLYIDPPVEWFLEFSFLMGVLSLTFLVFSSTDISLRLKVLFQKTSNEIVEPQQPLLGLEQRFLLLLHYIWWFIFIRALWYSY